MLIFISGFVKPRALVLVTAILVGYLGISVFVTYMRDRGEIREAVWGGQSMQIRVSQLQKTITDFEWFDVSNAEHLRHVDGRLNQSFLAGLAVIPVGSGDRARRHPVGGAGRLGSRALWPDKPLAAVAAIW